MFNRIEAGPGRHPGRSAVRSLLDTFKIDGPDGRLLCLVHPPLWENVLGFVHRNPIRRLAAPVLAFVLHRTFQALDYLHTHTQALPDYTHSCTTIRVPSSILDSLTDSPIRLDIKASNLMSGIGDNSVFTDFEEAEIQKPSPRKEDADGRIICVSR